MKVIEACDGNLTQEIDTKASNRAENAVYLKGGSGLRQPLVKIAVVAAVAVNQQTPHPSSQIFEDDLPFRGSYGSREAANVAVRRDILDEWEESEMGEYEESGEMFVTAKATFSSLHDEEVEVIADKVELFEGDGIEANKIEELRDLMPKKRKVDVTDAPSQPGKTIFYHVLRRFTAGGGMECETTPELVAPLLPQPVQQPFET
ncbi:hypothetical protein FGG08_003880 [Glutinoglossum americanum]|uniref:Uncharacterized protein n=1 Tax=Glutinoglossum americanum TaxID=1670608 RepID=A0A9P8I675_9PEZI|nr:hypothetical protein FGG08_003880 [Glutinoglossum americanum]